MLQRSSLTFRILQWVVVTSAVIFLLASAAGVIHERARAYEAAHEQARTSVENSLESLSLALWNYDEGAWRAILQGLANTPSIARVELADLDRTVAAVDNPMGAGRADTSTSYVISAPHGGSRIGTLTVHASHAWVDRQIEGMVRTQITTEFIKVVALASAIFFIVYRQVTVHLRTLAQAVTRVEPNDLNARVALDRRTGNHRAPDEFDVLVEAMNNFLQDRATRTHELSRSEERLRCLIEMSSDFYWETDAEHRLTRRTESAREAMEQVFEHAPSVGKRRWEVPYLLPDEAGWRAHRQTLDAHLPFRNFEILRLRENGARHYISVSGDPVFDEKGTFVGYRGVGADITDRKLAEERINELAFYDPLTNLPNRRLLLDRLRQALTASHRSRQYGALLFVDLDNFKMLNDTLGHDMGDQLLQQVARRLTNCVREADTVGRLGGDEFVVILEALSTDAHEAVALADGIGQKILFSLNNPYKLGESEQRSTPSIGVTLFMDAQDSTDELLKRADLAMYQAKASGRNALRFFDPNMQAMIRTRAGLEEDLHIALARQQFLLHYQPQVVDDGKVVGAEVLLRWQHPDRGLVPPATFIPLAEETGLILPIGQWVLESVCEQLALWAGHPVRGKLTVSINVSARQFRSPTFVDEVLEALRRHPAARPQQLKLELTESLLVDDIEDVIHKMGQLQARGVGFALDDFGTGYSSLAYLKRLPLDQLKIDQGFVRDILSDPNDAAIAKMIVALAESMGLAVIAEGVETTAQRDFLARLGCFAYQGFLFGRPVPLDEFERRVA